MQDDTIKQESPRNPLRADRQLFLSLVYPAPEQTGRSHRFMRIGSGIDVGREPSQEPAFRVLVGTVSRTHFSIGPKATGWVIKDRGSSNGTRLNGEIVTEARLFDQDVVRAGGAVFVATSSPPVDLGWMERYGVVGCSGPMGVAAEAARSALKDMGNVLILGETGTGKEMIASMIHRAGKRTGNFVPVNCGAIPEHLVESTLFGCLKGSFTGADADRPGLLQEAEGGTLLLDEIAELSQGLQVKLLRTLEERTYMPVGATRSIPFDVKILAATNRLDAIQDPTSGFRQDLLARLEDLVIYLPPLRQRREEIILLLLSTLKEFNAETKYDPGFVEAILTHDWPRNTRQLLKTIKQVTGAGSNPEAITADTLHLYLGTWPRGHTDAEDAATTHIGVTRPSSLLQTSVAKSRRDGPPPRAEFEVAWIANEYNVSAVARHFACDRRQIYRWLERFGIERES